MSRPQARPGEQDEQEDEQEKQAGEQAGEQEKQFNLSRKSRKSRQQKRADVAVKKAPRRIGGARTRGFPAPPGRAGAAAKAAANNGRANEFAC